MRVQNSSMRCPKSEPADRTRVGVAAEAITNLELSFQRDPRHGCGSRSLAEGDRE